MSASLVGSEMCIRDRRRSSTRGSRRTPAGPGAPSPRRRLQGAPPRGRTMPPPPSRTQTPTVGLPPPGP
eukprot:8310662-Alexandrium_andersonii.AAC.1